MSTKEPSMAKSNKDSVSIATLMEMSMRAIGKMMNNKATVSSVLLKDACMRVSFQMGSPTVKEPTDISLLNTMT